MTEVNLNPADFGPCGQQVVDFIQALSGIPWFAHVGQPLPEDAELIRVDFDFIARNYEAPYAPWQGLVEAAEAQMERLIFDQSRIAAQAALHQAVKLEPYAEGFFEKLYEEYEDYYGDTHTYAHELVELPDRLVRGAACERMLADLNPEPGFFQSLLPWFQRGHWPCGWEGNWPAGRLILW